MRECRLVYQLRPFQPERDFAEAFRLWEICLGEMWTLAESDFVRVLKGNPQTHKNHYRIAEIGQRMVGFAAAQYGKLHDSGVGVPLIMVHPEFRRWGIGTALYQKALEPFRAEGSSRIQLGAGGAGYFFQGVPDNLPEALAFFTAQGWDYNETSYDLVIDLTTYTTPPEIFERAAAQGIRFNHGLPYPPGAYDEAASEMTRRVKQQICAFERREFPSWAAYFEKAESQSYFTAWDSGNNIVGTLLMSAPALETNDPILWRGVLGEDTGMIGAVGVARSTRDRGIGSALVAGAFDILKAYGVPRCHIGWTWLLDFYGRLGGKPWRSFSTAWRE